MFKKYSYFYNRHPFTQKTMKTEHFRQPLSLMRFLAVILITNSHIGPLYPPHLQFLSTGGALGNSLFFFCSGFALYLSNRDTGFAPWAIRRFTRIYPSLWIFMTVCFLGGIQSFRLPDIIIPTFWSCKPSLCSMFSSSIPSSFLKAVVESLCRLYLSVTRHLFLCAPS